MNETIDSKERIRVLENVGMLLNQQGNINQFYDNVKETFSVYGEVLINNGVSNDFKESIERSRDYFGILPVNNPIIGKKFHFGMLKYNLDILKPGERDSFFLVPLNTEGHLFTGLVRKIDEKEDVYSLISTNLGQRSFEKFDKGTHIEYIFRDRNELESFLRVAGNTRLKAVEDVNFFLKEGSDEKYILNIQAKDQKAPNCFTKEIDKGIKTALLSLEDLAKARERGVTVKAGFEASIGKSTFVMHKEFIETFKRKYSDQPELLKEINEAFLAYTINKDIRARILGKQTILNNCNFDIALKYIDSKNISFLSKDEGLIKKIFPNLSKNKKEYLKLAISQLNEINNYTKNITKMELKDNEISEKVNEYIEKMMDQNIKTYFPICYAESTMKVSSHFFEKGYACFKEGLRHTSSLNEFLSKEQHEATEKYFDLAEKSYNRAALFFEYSYIIDNRNLSAHKSQEISKKNSLSIIQERINDDVKNQNWKKALINAKRAYEIEGNEKTKTRYENILDINIEINLEKGNLEKALFFSKSLLKLSPENQEYRKKHKSIKNDLKKNNDKQNLMSKQNRFDNIPPVLG